MKKNKNVPTMLLYWQSGQALLTLLIFIVIGMAVISVGVVASIMSAQSSQKYIQSIEALHAAEGGMENALMRTLRNPEYGGETLTVGLGTATITVTNGAERIITSIGRVGSNSRTVRVHVDDSTGAMNVLSWKEVN